MEGDIEALRQEVVELRDRVERARNELYALHLEYAAQHFHTQSLMQANMIEGLHQSAAQAEAEIVERRCRQLEATIDSHKTLLARLESNGF